MTIGTNGLISDTVLYVFKVEMACYGLALLMVFR
jgi:hypothetical protein